MGTPVQGVVRWQVGEWDLLGAKGTQAAGVSGHNLQGLWTDVSRSRWVTGWQGDRVTGGWRGLLSAWSTQAIGVSGRTKGISAWWWRSILWLAGLKNVMDTVWTWMIGFNVGYLVHGGRKRVWTERKNSHESVNAEIRMDYYETTFDDWRFF